MATLSAGLVLYRTDRAGELQVLLVHPGGPFWARKDVGAWSIPKGEYEPTDDPFVAACREYREELGVAPPDGPAIDLGEVRQKAGKRVRAFAVEGDLDPTTMQSNTFAIEWPPRSGSTQEFPEVDRAEWFSVGDAREKLLDGQRPLLEVLIDALAQR